MSKIKTCNKSVFVAFCAFLFSAFFAVALNSHSAFAASNGILENGDARWEYVVDGNELSIKFYDKTPSATTVVVPSLDWLKSNISGLPNGLDTYFLRDADQDQQDSDYSPSPARRTPTADTTVLDMTNAAKIQIMGVQPIIDPAVETELKFGSEIVIGDTFTKTAYYYTCGGDWHWDNIGKVYTCYNWVTNTVTDFDSFFPNYSSMSLGEKASFEPKLKDYEFMGCIVRKEYSSVPPVDGQCYLISNPGSNTTYTGGAFAGYKLKLTNFSSSNFNYVGYQAFKGSTFNEANTNITIDGNSLLGGSIFENTNIKSVEIRTNSYGSDMFKDCTSLTSATIGDEVTFVAAGTFQNTNIGTSIDFSQLKVKRIGARAFDGVGLTEVNFTGIERIDFRAFANNDIREIYLPESISFLQASIFLNNANLKKATIAYDTLTSGTTLPFWEITGGVSQYGYVNYSNEQPLEDLTVIAPYADDEEVSATHVTYDDYLFGFDTVTQEHTGGHQPNTGGYNSYGTLYRGDDTYKFEYDYADVDSKKNVIAPLYFANFKNLKTVVIGEGYEYIGSSAFWYTAFTNTEWPTKQKANGLCDLYYDEYNGSYWEYSLHTDVKCGERYLEKIQLPSTLKGVGNLALQGSYAPNIEINLPQSLEFVGISAFQALFHMNIDLDLPNLKYIGDFAFASTSLNNVTIHDAVHYWGDKAFSSIPTLKDITLDLDLFSPEKVIPWAWIDDRDRNSDPNKGSQWFRMQFGSYSGSNGWYYRNWEGTEDNSDDLARWGIPDAISKLRLHQHDQKFGKITFTEKVVHPIPMRNHDNDYDTGDNNFFSQTIADEVDLSAVSWKILPRKFFNYSEISKITLPANLEIIGHHAFCHMATVEEIVIPDSVRIIGAYAFESGGLEKLYYFDDDYNKVPAPIDSPIITKLPASLEYVGYAAFEGDFNLTADLNAANLQYIGPQAFMNTGIRDVYIPDSIQWLGEGTFANTKNLRDIVIDADFASIVNAEFEDSYEMPEALIEWAGNDETEASYEVRSKNLAECSVGDDNCDKIGSGFNTFYSIFGKTYSWGTVDMGWYSYPGWVGSDQLEPGNNFGSLIFTDKNVTNLDGTTGIFSGLTFGVVDMGATSWTNITEQSYAFNQAHIGTLILPGGVKTINEGAFHDAVIENEFEVPATTKTIERAAFQSATGTITNALPEGVKTIEEAAFYDADMTDNLVIPSTVTFIGESAFNAGSKDVHYNTVTIKPALTFDETDDQLVHQFMWNSSVDKLIVESSTLPALDYGISAHGDEEFWNMDMNEVVLKNLTGISFAAFDSCTNLVKVDATGDPDLVSIGEEAFVGDEKLDTLLFASGSKNKTISVGPNAFNGTAFTELGGAGSKFDLTAAKFDASAGHSFANMPKLKKVTVPRSFSGAIIPEYTFYNDELLEEASIDYKITDIKNAAFALDNNLKRIFIWGDTIVEDQSLDGYTAPTRGPSRAVVGPTIPEGTDIYAYSTAKTEAYAASEQRADFTGTFYPLDEVLYLTSNHPTVLLNEDDTDFDKSNLVVYAMRRDGIVLESDSWQEFDGNAYARAGKGLTFEHMAETIADNAAFGTVWDTPVPVAELDLSNQNFANLAYAIRPADDDPAVLTVDLKHSDLYTTYLANTNVDPRDYVPEPEPEPEPTPTPEPEPEPTPEPEPEPTPAPEPEPETPKTGDEIVKYVTILASGVAAGAILLVAKKRH